MAESIHELVLNETDTDEVVEPVLTDIRKVWRKVRRGIRSILLEQSQLTFIPEDVYAACVNGQALLWTTDEGFVITTSEVDEFNDERSFLIWLAFAYGGTGGKLVMKHQQFFENAARDAGYKALEVRSPVLGLKEYLLFQGWEIDTIVYTRRLDGQ